MFDPIRMPKLHEEVQHQIRSLIDGGVLKPGQTLPPERELARQLGVSRNGLREALRVLETKGIIVTRHGVGRSVRDIRPTALPDWSLTSSIEVVTISEVLEIRELLEPSAAALACERGTEDELRAMLTASEGAGSWHDTERFHHAVAVAAHNYVLEQLVLQQTHLLDELRQRDHYSSRHDVGALVAEHRLIAAAIWRRDAAQAQALMRKHLQQTRLSIEHDSHDTSPRPSSSDPTAAHALGGAAHLPARQAERAVDLDDANGEAATGG